MSENIDPLKELEAMKAVAVALTGLDTASIRRVLGWAADHFGMAAVAPTRPAAAGGPETDAAANGGGTSNFSDLADLFAQASPSTEAHQALVGAYWVQYMENADSVDSQSVNTKLKHIGHGIGNITRAFENLKKTKPQLVVQMRKAGQTQQARKTYKVTSAGKDFVENLLNAGGTK